MSTPSWQVYGIRHHGPGSTKRLLKALRQQQPDCVLIEAPQDGEEAFKHLLHPKLVPPVAMLMYHPKDLSRAAYLPFAKFSPEWQAATYALQKQVPLRAMDLPMGITFEQQEHRELPFEQGQAKRPPWVTDPLGYMARLAGYTDTERWWEVTFEEEGDDLRVFEVILEMMEVLRNESEGYDRAENQLREAFMRKTIRKALKDGYQNLAIVCGAWHGPPLQHLERFQAKDDNKLLRGLKKTSVKSTWIPWSYERLARGSGYGAGVEAPAWCEMLYSPRKETAVRWMIQVARLFRREDLDASVAHVQEAVRLANTLATMRGRQLAGIDELEEAAISVICGGQTAPLDLIRERLVRGDVIGKVPDDIPAIPLQQDLKQCVKSARLTKEFNTTETVTKELDLRKPANLLASQLLHRLLLLQIPWGTPKDRRETEQGRFRERWSLKWRADYALRLIEAGMYGNTVREAAGSSTRRAIQDAEDPTALTRLLDSALKADLPGLTAELLTALRKLAALSRDIPELMQTVTDLTQVWRYGANYETDEAALRELIQELVPRICAGLPLAVTQIDDEMARTLFQRMVAMQGALSVIQDEDLSDIWSQTLQRLPENEAVHPLIRGWVVRWLINQRISPAAETGQRMSRALSPANPPDMQAAWLEGFLQGSGLLLMHQTDLWRLLNEWVDRLTMPQLEELLPVLRRSFSHYSPQEREWMLQRVFHRATSADSPDTNASNIDAERAAIIHSLLHRILGS